MKKIVVPVFTTIRSPFIFTGLLTLALPVFTGCVKNLPTSRETVCPAMVKANGVNIRTESFGNPSDPAVLLIMHGINADWEDDFCSQLAEGERYVIRYDNRDTGQSVTYPVGKPGYSLADMVKDATRVLDSYGIQRVHLVGASLGGMIAQNAAIDQPGRVLSLTLIMSSPHGPEGPRISLPCPKKC